jgi:hypothetical protein
MLAFFRAAYVIHEGEAALVLHYHPGRRTFRWHCPDQFVETYRSLGRLCAYDFIHFDLPLEIPDGYVIFGDSHCHGSLSAVPSRVDERDESFQDGLHLIVGHIDRPRKVQYHADFVMDGYRFNLPPASVLDDVTCEPLSEPPRSWLERIHLRGRPSWGLSTMGAYRDERRSE